MARTGDYISLEVRKEVASRAGYRCEYCLIPEYEDFFYYKHQVDHIKSIKHRGTSDLQNLAYSCFHCNSFKGADVGSFYDPTGLFVVFYNPRTDVWTEHFELRNFVIEPITATGWVTAMMLQFNTQVRIDIRRLLY